MQANSLLSADTTSSGTYDHPRSYPPTQRIEARSRRSTEDDAAGDIFSGHGFGHFSFRCSPRAVPAAVLAALSGALSRILSREALRLRPGGSVLA